MPRGKTFDPDEKIDQAIDLFWRNGCDAVSIQDIVDALGINRGSLYATYGDKEQLWLLALGRYCDVRKARLAELNADQAGPVLPQVRALLAELTQPAEGLPRGCLVVNAITERTADTATRELALRQIGNVEDTLATALERARDTGEIAAGASPRQLARFLVVMLQGLHVYNRAVADPRPVHDAIEVAMSAISASGQPDLPDMSGHGSDGNPAAKRVLGGSGALHATARDLARRRAVGAEGPVRQVAVRDGEHDAVGNLAQNARRQVPCEHAAVLAPFHEAGEELVGRPEQAVDRLAVLATAQRQQPRARQGRPQQGPHARRDIPLLVHQQRSVVRPHLLGEQIGHSRRPEADASGRGDRLPEGHPTPATKLDRRHLQQSDPVPLEY